MKGGAQAIPGLSHQVLVQIEIAHRRIHCYPRRASDVLIYRPRRAGTPVHALPLEVRWVVSGLGRGQHVRIVPKDPEDTTFASGDFRIGPRTNTLRSGRPTHGAGPGHCFLWRYGILLLSGTRGKVLDRLDPGVIIKDHP